VVNSLGEILSKGAKKIKGRKREADASRHRWRQGIKIGLNSLIWDGRRQTGDRRSSAKEDEEELSILTEVGGWGRTLTEVSEGRLLPNSSRKALRAPPQRGLENTTKVEDKPPHSGKRKVREVIYRKQGAFGAQLEEEGVKLGHAVVMWSRLWGVDERRERKKKGV